MWRVLQRGYQAEPRLLTVSFALALLSALPDALLALWLKVLADGILSGHRNLVFLAASGLGVSAAATWFLKVFSDRIQRRFRDQVSIALEAHVAHLQAAVATIAHHERPEYLDRLGVLRNQVFVLDHIYMSIFSTGGWLLRLAITLVLLVSISPWLALLALFAIPTIASSSWRPGIERAAQERGAAANRLARHYFELATTAAAGKEVRVAGIAPRLIEGRRSAWERWYGPIRRTRRDSAIWHAAAWALFAAAYVGAVAWVASRPDASVGNVLLVLAAGSRLSYYVAATAGEIGFLRMWLDGSRRLAWLEDYAASVADRAKAAAPAALADGIRLENVSFAYPGSDRLVLQDVDLRLARGAVVAIVGENGAGKTTLVKLLCRMYLPTKGRILVDEVDLATVDADNWRARVSGAFQDFFRFEFTAADDVGLGDLPRLVDRSSIATAVGRAGAGDVIERLEHGLDTQLGPTWPNGVDLSLGQWQKIALARGFMRDRPLLLILDEPTASLDAETEHALFERYAAASRRGDDDGRITLLVSHRFSTVRMADTIIVLDGARVVESGTHEELMVKGGQYAELYGIQAAAYK
jgi:ATP-binding cassette subfamily B protein